MVARGEEAGGLVASAVRATAASSVGARATGPAIAGGGVRNCAVALANPVLPLGSKTPQAPGIRTPHWTVLLLSIIGPIPVSVALMEHKGAAREVCGVADNPLCVCLQLLLPLQAAEERKQRRRGSWRSWSRLSYPL